MEGLVGWISGFHFTYIPRFVVLFKLAVDRFLRKAGFGHFVIRLPVRRPRVHKLAVWVGRSRV
jgi:hypothetical protein